MDEDGRNAIRSCPCSSSFRPCTVAVGTAIMSRRIVRDVQHPLQAPCSEVGVERSVSFFSFPTLAKAVAPPSLTELSFFCCQSCDSVHSDSLCSPSSAHASLVYSNSAYGFAVTFPDLHDVLPANLAAESKQCVVATLAAELLSMTSHT
jgi:hypothetical protein